MSPEPVQGAWVGRRGGSSAAVKRGANFQGGRKRETGGGGVGGRGDDVVGAKWPGPQRSLVFRSHLHMVVRWAWG